MCLTVFLHGGGSKQSLCFLQILFGMLTSETEFTEQILRPLISVICGFPKEPDCFHFIALYGKSGKVHFCKGVFGIAVALIGGLSEPALRLQEILLDSITQMIQLAETVLRILVSLFSGEQKPPHRFSRIV